MKEQIKDYIKSRIETLEKESIDLGCELKYDEAMKKSERIRDLWKLQDYIKELEWKEMDNILNNIKL